MPSQNEVYPDVTINLGRIYARMVLGEILEYSCAEESPIQCGVSHFNEGITLVVIYLGCIPLAWICHAQHQ